MRCNRLLLLLLLVGLAILVPLTTLAGPRTPVDDYFKKVEGLVSIIITVAVVVGLGWGIWAWMMEKRDDRQGDDD